MTDTPPSSTTPETTPPVSETTAPLDLGNLAKKAVQDWIYEAMGDDDVWLNYIRAHPEGVENAVSLFGLRGEQINTREALKTLDITYRIGLLIYAAFKSAGEKSSTQVAKTTPAGSSPESNDANAEVSLLNQLKEKGKTLGFADFKKYWEAKSGDETPLFVEPLKSVWRGEPLLDWVKISAALNGEGKDVAKEWPERFPYPAGSRVVVDETTEELQRKVGLPAGKSVLDTLGLRMTVASLDTLPTPAEDEVQFVSLQDVEPMTWDHVQAAAKLWDDAVPTQFSGAPKTLAAIQALNDQGPIFRESIALCAAVGYSNPDAAFLEFLKTVPR